MAKKLDLKVCLECGDKKFADDSRIECDICEVDYVLEAEVHAATAKVEAKAKAVEEARAGLDKALAG